MLWRTEASLRQVSSAMSSTLSNLGGFIFCKSSFGTWQRLPVSMISTSTSSPLSPLMEAETNPKLSWGIHTSLFWVHSAWVVGSLKAFRSTTRYLKSGSLRSRRESASAILCVQKGMEVKRNQEISRGGKRDFRKKKPRGRQQSHTRSLLTTMECRVLFEQTETRE